MKKHFAKIEIFLVCIVWIGLTAFSWFSPALEFSLSERRKLKQFPELSLEAIENGSFMKDFESFTLDQFPLRDTFRTIKALAAFGLFNQKDNNDVYIAQGQASKLEPVLNEGSLRYAKDRLTYLMDKYFAGTDANLYFSIVPDKGYYLAEKNGYLSMDYDKMVGYFKEQLVNTQYVDLFPYLSADNYYATDSHWKQEDLLKVAEALATAMGVQDSIYKDYELVETGKDFYGVYYGQAALPLAPDTIKYLTNKYLEECIVYNIEKNEVGGIYNESKLDSWDPYEFFLSGAVHTLVIENPNAAAERELVVFRDSYGSSLIPLLVGAYSKVTVLDTRYIHPNRIADYCDLSAADDVLFMYSTSVLNSSMTLRNEKFGG